MHPVDGAQQGGFTGTGTADDGDKFTILDGQVYIVQPHGAIGVYLGYMVKLNHTVSSSAVRIRVSFINRDTHAGDVFRFGNENGEDRTEESSNLCMSSPHMGWK